MLILPADAVRLALPMEQAIPAMKQAYAALSSGQAEVPLRSRLPIPRHEAVSLFMPAFVQDQVGEALAVKIVSIFPKNPERGLSLIQSAVLVLEADSGKPLALLEGSSLTAIRTGAASGAATDLLARQDSQIVAIFGAGIQGRTQLEAVCAVRPIRTAWIYDRNRDKTESFVAEMSGKGNIPADLRLAANPRQAVESADVICTATTSLSPVFTDQDLRAGVHINAVGSYTPEMQEIPADTVFRARVVVDSRPACMTEAGDLLQPIWKGVIDEGHIQAELGEIVLGLHAGRENESQVTLFKSVGVAVQDAAAARLALQRAEALHLGQAVSW